MTERTKSTPIIIVCVRCKRERSECGNSGMCKLCRGYSLKIERFKNAPLKKCECSEECQVMIKAWDKFGIPRKYAVGHNGRLNIGKNNGQYKNGISKTSGGYYQYLFRGHPFSTKKGRVMIHRIVYEMYHICCMLPWGDIHHRDGNIKRNHPENLQGMMHVSHMSLTHKDIKHKRKRIRRKCYDCGSTKTFVRKSNNSPFWYRVKGIKQIRYRCHTCHYRLRREKKKLSTYSYL